MIQVREFTSGAEVLAHALEIRRKFYGPRQVPLARVFIAPEKAVRAEETFADPIGSSSAAAFRHPHVDTLRAAFRLHYTNIEPTRVSMDAIVNRLAKAFNVSVLDIKSERRTVQLTLPRHAFCFLAKELTGKSFPSIGRFLGGRDHTTILNGAKRCQAVMAHDPDYRLMVLSVRSHLEGRA
jgi:chromosomal replication initiation ATPase DnaA